MLELKLGVLIPAMPTAASNYRPDTSIASHLAGAGARAPEPLPAYTIRKNS